MAPIMRFGWESIFYLWTAQLGLFVVGATWTGSGRRLLVLLVVRVLDIKYKFGLNSFVTNFNLTVSPVI